jgi:hypothetical protein
MLEVSATSTQATTALRVDIFADPGSYANTHMQVRRRPPVTDRLSATCIERQQEMIGKCAGVHW